MAPAIPTGLTATALTGQGWNVNVATLTATRSDPLSPSGSYPPLTLTVNVAANAAASLTTTATVSGGGDTNGSNNTASNVISISQPDLTVVAEPHSVFNQGDFGNVYTLTVSNAGLSPTNAAVSVADTLPAGVVATAMTGTGWTVNLSNLTATRSDALAAGGTYPPLLITVNVLSSAAAGVTNTATVSGGGEINTANDTSTDVTVIQQPDMAVNVAHSGTFNQGDVGDTYTITVSNTGLAASRGTVSLTDTLPTGMTATAMSGTGWTVNLAALTATRTDSLAAGASYPVLTLTVDVAGNAAASVTNTAVVSGGSETNASNDTASDIAAIAQAPDLTVAVAHSVAFTQGDAADTYTITVTNSGNGPTSGTVSLVDSLPAGLTATAMSGTGWTVNLSTLTATQSDALVAGSSYPAITLTVSVAANAADTLTNVVTVSGGGELKTANNVATDATPILGASSPPTVLSVTPSLSGGVLVAGNATSLAIAFSKTVVGGATAGNYKLQSAGADGLLGTADDVFTSLVAGYSGTTATLSFSTLPVGVYRLTVTDAIIDTSGHKLDGDGDNSAGGNFVCDFTVVAMASNPLFDTASTYGVGGSPYNIATGDFNRDGRLDLAIANGSNIVVLLASSSGGFASAVSYSSGDSRPYGIAVGDLNGDGIADIVVGNYNNSTVGVLLGRGDGTFAPVVTYASGGANADAVAIADVNGDGKRDVIVTNNWGGNVGVLLGNGDGTLGAVTTYSVLSSFPQSVAVADFNGDGRPDLAVPDAWGHVDVFLNNGNGTFAGAVSYGPNTSNPLLIATGDFNGDGKTDLAAANANNGTVSVMLGNGNGTFAADVTYSTGGSAAYGVATGDFNKDGYLDLAVTNSSSGTVGILPGKGNGTFGSAVTYSVGGSTPYAVISGDFNGDGALDLAVANEGSGTVGVLPRIFVPAASTLTSPSGYTFNMPYSGYGAGQLLQGTANAFDGLNRLQVGSADYAPTASAATLTNNGQTLVLPTQTLAGLVVSRSVTVPNAGGSDFARTIDTFQNTTTSSITTAVTIVGNLGSDAATTVFATSDGTGVVSTADQWIGTDDAIDGGGTPAVIHYIHGPAGLKPTSVSVSRDNISWTYSLTVPAGQNGEPGDVHDAEHYPCRRDHRGQRAVTGNGFGGEAGLLLPATSAATILNFAYGFATVSATSIDSGYLTAGFNSVSVTFGKPVVGSNVAANYRLQSAGADGLLGTADDSNVSLTSAASGGLATIGFGTLSPGVYRLTVLDSITDLQETGSTAMATVWQEETSLATLWLYRSPPTRLWELQRRSVAAAAVRCTWASQISMATASPTLRRSTTGAARLACCLPMVAARIPLR